MSIYAKLFKAKKEIGKISKDAKNPFFKSNYLSLNGLIDAIENVLDKNELLLLQPIIDGKVRTEIRDSTKDGTTNVSFVYSEMELPNITDPQKLGSAITYYRRYTLQSLLGLQAEDDDGNKAAQPSKVWINEKQVQQAIDQGVETIKKTIAYYDGKTVKGGSIYCMKPEFKTILETALTV
jgi:hypothetical protein